jgi:hypothetical protein
MSIRAFAVLAAAAFFTGPTAAAADPQLLNLVMPEAKVLAGVNVEQARTTPFGQYVLGRMQRDERSLKQFMEATGFDPRRDVREVLIASTGQPSGTHPPTGLVLASGTFDVARIVAAAQAKGGVVETHEGVTVLSGLNKGGAVAFLSPWLAAAGQAEEVRAAIGRRNAPASLDPALAVKVNRFSTTQDAWVVSLVPPSVAAGRHKDPVLQGLMGGELLQAIQEASAGVKFGPHVDVSSEVVTATAQDASALAGVVRLLAVMAEGNAQGAPAAALLRTLQVSADGSTVRVGLSVPQDVLEGLLEKSRPAARVRQQRR